MIYIKIDRNGIVTLGGQVANAEMLAEGYFEFIGTIPAITNHKYSHLVFDGTNMIEVFDETKLEEVKKEKLLAVTKDYEIAVQALVGEVGNFELASWAKQEEQARKFLADPLTVVPLLSGLAASRGLGETLSQLATLIVQKADAYEIGYSSILGALQSKTKAISIATTVSEVLLVPTIDHNAIVQGPVL